MSPSAAAIRHAIRQLYQSMSVEEEKRCLWRIAEQSSLLNLQEQQALQGDPGQLTSEQQYRIWEWVHDWESTHKRDWEIEQSQPDTESKYDD
ncbi:MAG: hypothetical protein NW237_05255 [Cyanobacteriota bacterium]|nr:hypothetical protein [Cyanobacteriota bacterium]